MTICKKKDGVNWILQRDEKFKGIRIVEKWKGGDSHGGVRSRPLPSTSNYARSAVEDLLTVDNDTVELNKDAADMFHSAIKELQYQALKMACTHISVGHRGSGHQGRW